MSDSEVLPEPYYDDGMVRIFHADCVVLLPLLDPSHFSVMVTDPPYGMAYQSNWFGTLQRNVEGDEDTHLRDAAVAWWGDRPALVFGTWRQPRPACTRAVLIYDKGGATGMGDLSIPWKPSHEEIYVLGREWAGSRDCGSVVQGRVQAMAKNGRVHPTQKDDRTIEGLLSKCIPGPVLDPFMGSGSTLVAAKRLGRRAVGIELDERYCEVAARRLAQGSLAFGDRA